MLLMVAVAYAYLQVDNSAWNLAKSVVRVAAQTSQGAHDILRTIYCPWDCKYIARKEDVNDVLPLEPGSNKLH